MFHSFQKLPPELRQYIWTLALPDQPATALFTIKSNVWRLRKEAQAPDPATKEKLVYEFHGGILDPVNITEPLAHTNHEARTVVKTWLRKKSYEKPRDVLYLPVRCWQRFFDKTDNLLASKENTIIGPAVQRLAVPERLMLHEWAIWQLGKLLVVAFPHVVEVILVCGDTFGNALTKNCPDIDRQWRLERGAGYCEGVWDIKDEWSMLPDRIKNLDVIRFFSAHEVERGPRLRQQRLSEFFGEPRVTRSEAMQ